MMEQQRSAEWFAARLGLCSASRFKHALARLKPKKDETKGAPAQARIDYAIELVTERLTGQPTPHFTTAAMQWGIDQEPGARIELEFKLGVEVRETGFHRHPSLMCGASPDGLIGSDSDPNASVVEFKCPSSIVHAETWLYGMPHEHRAQVQGQLWITGRKRALFCSYDPRFPKSHQLYIEHVERDDVFIANLDLEVRQFLAEVDDLERQLREKAA
jgi:hypothetical protein